MTELNNFLYFYLKVSSAKNKYNNTIYFVIYFLIVKFNKFFVDILLLWQEFLAEKHPL